MDMRFNLLYFIKKYLLFVRNNLKFLFYLYNMSYITRFTLSISKKQIEKKLKNPKKTIDLSNIKTYKIGNFISSQIKDGFVHGKIVVKRSYDDFFFDLNSAYEIEKEPNTVWIYDEVNFTIYPDIKIISFTSKEKAVLFGVDLLSNILFDESKKIGGLLFYPQAVLEAKQKGLFGNVWFNGVRFNGKIGYMNQYGEEIDEDRNFINDAEKREGIGIVFYSKTGKYLKIGVFKSGALVRKSKLKDFKDDIKLEKEVIKSFLPYSNYGIIVPDKTVDDFTSLVDFL